MRRISIKQVKRILVVGMIGSIMLNTFGCTNNNKNDINTDPITFTLYNADGTEDPWNDPVAKKITEATGVTVNIEYPSSESSENRIQLMVATGEYPDLIFAKGDVELLIDRSQLIDMSPLIDEYGPHIKELYGEYYEALRYSEDNPAIYTLCSSRAHSEILTTSGTAQMQWAVLQANDYKIPTTLEEYTTMIRNYLDENPTTENGDRTIGISISCSDWHWYTTLSDPAGYIANGSSDDGQWIVDKDYNVSYKFLADGQKDYFRWLNAMYSEGILDSEFATQTHEDYLGKIADGRVLGLLDTDWDYSSAETILKARGNYKATYAGLPITIDESVKCAALKDEGLAIGWGIGITKACKDPVRAIQFLDWMCTDEAQILLNWGIEDVNYFYDEDGIRYRTDEEIEAFETDANYKLRTGVTYHTYPYPCYGSGVLDSTGNTYTTENKATTIAGYSQIEKEALEAWNCEMLTDIFPQADEFEKKYYTPLWSKNLPYDIKQEVELLDGISWNRLVDCIVCKPQEFDAKWKILQDELIDAGALEVQEKMTKIVRKEVEFRKSIEE